MKLGPERNQDSSIALNMNFIFYFGKVMTLVNWKILLEDNNILNTECWLADSSKGSQKNVSNLTWTGVGGRAKLVWMKRLIFSSSSASSSSSSDWNNQIDAPVTFLSETKWQFGANGFHYPIRKAEEKCNQPVGLVWSPCTFLQFVQSSFHEEPKWVVVFLIPWRQISCYTIPRLKTQAL